MTSHINIEKSAMLKRVLVTFDIDGTIFLSTNSMAIRSEAYATAFRRFFGVDPSPGYLGDFGAGMTDLQTTLAVFKGVGCSHTKEDIAEFMNEFDCEFVKHDLADCRTPPGVRDAISEVRNIPNVSIGIATGCSVKTALHRLRSVDLANEFVQLIGGFGDNPDRTRCILKAKLEAEKLRNADIDAVLHIGDTPADYHAACSAKARSLSVLTGVKDRSSFPATATIVPDLNIGLPTLLALTTSLVNRE